MSNNRQHELEYGFLLFSSGVAKGLDKVYDNYGFNITSYIAERTGSCVHADEVSKFIIRSAFNQRQALNDVSKLSAYLDDFAKQTVLIYLYHTIRMRLHFLPVLPKDFGAFENMFRGLVHQAARSLVPQHAPIITMAIRNLSDEKIAKKLKITIHDVSISKEKSSEKLWDHFEQFIYPHLSIPLHRHTPTEFVPTQGKYHCERTADNTK